MLAGYNGKPFLTRPQHTFFKVGARLSRRMAAPWLTQRCGAQTREMVEAFIDVHTFSYIARKSFYAFINDRFPHMVMDMGVTVEGRCDEELPEQIIGTLRVHRVDLKKVATL